jgi:type II secretory pathway pseudopilin PulG
MNHVAPKRILLVGVIVALLIGIGGIGVLRFLFGRTRQFQKQAEAGQPIVRAIEAFQKQTGSYPTSLTDLAPKFLPSVPDIPDKTKGKFEGWDYAMETNGTSVSYTLRYYMGRGGVEYRAPHWIGNNEGSRKIVLSNE